MSKAFVIKDTLTPGLKAYFKKAGVGASGDRSTADFKARQAVGLQLLNFTVNGSSGETVVPPIRWGVLRGSGSAFVDNVMIGDTKGTYPDGTPNKEYRSHKGGLSVGFNTAYAARMHETKWVPGGKVPSKQSTRNPGILANVGNKFLEKHLKADGKVLLGLYSDIFKKETGG